MNYSKIVGWLVFSIGLALIAWTLFSSYNIFTGKTDVPEIFKFSEVAKTSSPKSGTPGLQDIQNQIQAMLGEQLKSFLPTDTLPKMLNLAIWSILAWILVSGGAQISNLGIKLIKN